MQTIVLPRRLDKLFIQLAPADWVFLYSSSVHNEKLAGQASVCIGEPNCYRIPVRWSQCRSSGYMSDNQMRDIMIELEVAISKVPSGVIVIPFPRIGCGASRFLEFAPKCWNAMNQLIDEIKYKNITYSKI